MKPGMLIYLLTGSHLFPIYILGKADNKTSGVYFCRLEAVSPEGRKTFRTIKLLMIK